MGKDIVFQESHGEPGERSRVWCEDDINHLLTNNTGTNKVLGINNRLRSCAITWNPKSFSEMKNLRYICMGEYIKHQCVSRDDLVEYDCFSGDTDYLSNQLRWLQWPEFPLQSFPSNFQANKLVELNIPYSRRITRLWKGRKNFSSLTRMYLSGCESLTELPDFGGIPNLKELDLFGCSSLVEVPESLGLLDKLVTLYVDRCSNLVLFPRKINLKSAKTISISYCKLEEFSVGEEMGSLTFLNLSGSRIKELHPSILELTGLEYLILAECHYLTTLPYNMYELHNLNYLNASMCSSLATFPVIPMKMDSLRQLLLGGSDIIEMDESIGNLIRLEEFGLYPAAFMGCKIWRGFVSVTAQIWLDFLPTF